MNPLEPLSHAVALLQILGSAFEDAETLQQKDLGSELVCRPASTFNAAFDGIAALIALGGFLAQQEGRLNG